ncbi:hypothetical protein D3C75_1020210 [compost metagenome]
MRPTVCPDNFCVTVHTCRDFTGRTFGGFHQTQTGEVWQTQRAFTAFVCFAFGTRLRNVPESIRAYIAKFCCIFCCADTERVQHHNKCTFHNFSCVIAPETPVSVSKSDQISMPAFS